MTKDQFIDQFITASGMPKSAKTEHGIKQGRFERVAVECACGEHLCPGWTLIKPEESQRLSNGAVYTVKRH